jgi:cytochrome c oxidase subunit IV
MSDKPHAAGEHQEESMATYVIVFILLLVLLCLTYGAYLKDFGRMANLVIALIIAVIKASMVLMVFMHVRLSPKLVWIFAMGSFLWLVLMICGFLQDYRSRYMDGAEAHAWITPEAAAMAQAAATAK